MVKAGDIIDRYSIEAPIGEGGMGRVFRALDTRLERRVALKVLHDGGEGKESRARLVREARAVAKLDHPNIVSVFDVGEHEAGPFVVMELVDGRSLRSVIGDAGVAPHERARLMMEVARGLAVAHDAGIVHRDVKPENVIVRPDGRVKVLDFGIARRTRSNVDPSAPTDASLSTLTAEGVKIGTPAYMAPEQVRGGEIDGRADQFAWAVTAYELFVGRAPWSGDAMSLIAAILTEEPPPPPPEAQMPHPFAAVVKRALSKRADERFESMHALLKALEPEGAAASMPRMPSPHHSSPPLPSPGGYGGHVSSLPPGAYAGPPVASSAAAYAGPPQFVPSAALSRRYSTKEVADIFDRALSNQPRGFRYDEIAEAAREVGVDDHTLHQAMRELSHRGVVPVSDQQKSEDMLRVKRLLAIWGVLSAFFILLNLLEPYELWAPYPVICMGLPFGLIIVRILFRAPKRVPHQVTHDPAIEHDVARMTQYLRVRPEQPPRVRFADPTSAPISAAEAEAQAVAEAERARAAGVVHPRGH